MWGGIVARLFFRRNKGPSCANSPPSWQDQQHESQDGNRKSSMQGASCRMQRLVLKRERRPTHDRWGSRSSDLGGLAGGGLSPSPFGVIDRARTCVPTLDISSRGEQRKLVHSPAKEPLQKSAANRV
jgi:hypothetical protein